MRYFIYFLILITIFSSCSNNDSVRVEQAPKVEKDAANTFEERVAEIDKYTTLLYEDSSSFDVENAKKLLASYENYIQHHSFESDSRDYMFKAGELAKSLNKPHVAIKHFNRLLEEAPQHKKAPVALFYKAIIIGDMLGENDLAKTTYQEFIDNYPDHPFVESAKASIQLQGKSLEEIVAGFEKKNS